MKNKGKFLVFFVIFTALFGVLSPVLAETNTGFVSAGSSAGYDTANRDIVNYIQLVINFLLSAVAFVFFAMILYGGLRWMTSRGQEQLKEKAIDAITNAVIGLVIVVGAYALVTFVFGKLNPATQQAASATPTTATTSTNAGNLGCCVMNSSGSVSCSSAVTKEACKGTWFGNSLCQPTWCGSGSADYNKDRGAL